MFIRKTNLIASPDGREYPFLKAPSAACLLAFSKKIGKASGTQVYALP